MSTQIRARQRAATTGRFSRQAASARRSPTAGRRTVPRQRVTIRRRPPQKSGLGKALEGLTGLLPASASKGRRGGAKRKGTAGVALLAGAAGLALKNRDKLTSLLGRKGSSDEVSFEQPAVAEPTTAPPVGVPPVAASEPVGADVLEGPGDPAAPRTP
jgi:hypothetical protein